MPSPTTRTAAVQDLAALLAEDVGSGDVTTMTLVPAELVANVRIVAREKVYAAGITPVVRLLEDQGLTVTVHAGWLRAGQSVLDVSGSARTLLIVERTALNLLGRLLGVATRTRMAVEDVEAVGGRARIAGTRKTTPGLRVYEKAAIVAAGGEAHRMGLWDAAMIKDNHLAVIGDVAAAVARIRADHEVEITVEAESLETAVAAAAAGADWVLIDNQPPEVGRVWADEVRRHGARVEASGGIGLDDVAPYAWADRISLGLLTTGRALDVSLEWGR